ncbi:protein STPG4 isoform X2 [Takifugu rubripes]|uniref:protein STPG4 isoform X2 n=1 Tax=Takifugu rubripes TaxID=31033 RepID=UPI0011454C13|nr:protein STPG4 isoform X2 [Takifugu rubripes]
MSRGGKRTDKGGDKVDLSGRGRWWLEALKDTPDPGVYHIRDFIEEADLNPVKKTYGFKRVGRKAATLGTQSGHMLLPGAYNFPESDVPKPSFFFKACPRREVTLGVRDKNINTSPCDYGGIKPVEKVPCKYVPTSTHAFIPETPLFSLPSTSSFLPCHFRQTLLHLPSSACRHAAFRSTVRRIAFPPKEGPAPCLYNPGPSPAKGVTSCFRSTLPRLGVVHSSSPGPGTYEPYGPCRRLGDRLHTEIPDQSFSLLFRNSS